MSNTFLKKSLPGKLEWLDKFWATNKRYCLGTIKGGCNQWDLDVERAFCGQEKEWKQGKQFYWTINVERTANEG